MRETAQVDFFTPDLPDDTIFHVGVSGGKDSSAVLLWMIHDSGIPPARIDATFCDTVNEHQWTYEHIEMLSQRVHPIKTLTPPLGFFDLAWKKNRFPSTKARFCTEHLKIRVTAAHITELLLKHRYVVAVSGVRADESNERKDHLEWDYSGRLLTLSWRPLISWTLADVQAYHKKHDIPLNPLYSMGARRVGCWPCIMSRKAEIRNIALNFPERIDEIREQEQRFERERGRYSSFFPSRTVPPRFRSKPFVGADGRHHMVATIDDVVRWAMTGKRANGSYKDDEPEDSSGPRCMSGFCE